MPSQVFPVQEYSEILSPPYKLGHTQKSIETILHKTAVAVFLPLRMSRANFYSLSTKTLVRIYILLILGRKEAGGGERERFAVPLIYAFIGCFLHVP